MPLALEGGTGVSSFFYGCFGGWLVTYLIHGLLADADVGFGRCRILGPAWDQNAVLNQLPPLLLQRYRACFF